MKIRIEKSLINRARTCADAVEAPLGTWAGRALRHWRAGKLRVAKSGNAKNATRHGSTVCTLPGGQEEADDMRQALLAAVVYCESLRHPEFKTPLVEGRDYIVVREVS